jgi:hypothetical protein
VAKRAGTITNGSKERFLQAEGLLSSEVWQFAGMLGFFVVALFLWLQIVYLPGRTLERWEDQRVEVREESRWSEEPSTR